MFDCHRHPHGFLDFQNETHAKARKKIESDLEKIKKLEAQKSEPSPGIKRSRATRKQKPVTSTAMLDVKIPRRIHFIPENLTPETTARQFRSIYRRRSQVADYLRRVLKAVVPIKVDFDLAVAYFLQQTNHLALGDIPNSVNTIISEFSLLAPQTGRQENLAACARYIKNSLDSYASKPEGTLPFALRYPNLRALNQLAIDRSASPEIIGKEEAVVLVDLANRPLAIGIPPKRGQQTTTLSGAVGFCKFLSMCMTKY